MTPAQLQRMCVRMHFDPALTDAVYRDGRDPILNVALSARARALLTAPRRARWSCDPYRRARRVRGMMGRFLTATAWFVHVESAQALEHFFASVDFHAAVHRRASINLAFGTWLGAHARDATARALALLETALESARLDHVTPPRPPGVSTMWRLCAGVRCLSVAEGASERMHAIRTQLTDVAGPDTDPRDIALGGAWTPRGLAPVRSPPAPLLIHANPAGEVSVSHISEPLFDLLEAVARDGGTASLTAVAARHDTPADDLREVLGGLAEDGLVERPSSQAPAPDDS